MEPQLLLTKLLFLNPTLHPQVFDFTVSPEEMKQLNALNKNWRYIVPMLMVRMYQAPRLGECEIWGGILAQV